MAKCRTVSKNKRFVFKEQRSVLTLINEKEVASTQIYVDGCEINDTGVRCDYMLITDHIEMYVELKGQDITHALKQIQRTISMLSSDAKKQKKISYIICTRSPIASTEIQHLDRVFRAKFNSQLKIRSSPFADKY